MLETAKELWDFVKARKRYCLIPVMLLLILFGMLLFLAETSPVAPFIYTLF